MSSVILRNLVKSYDGKKNIIDTKTLFPQTYFTHSLQLNLLEVTLEK